jgi:hypothetical protein
MSRSAQPSGPGGLIRVQVIEPGDDPARRGTESVTTTVELAYPDALLFLAPFLEDGYTVLVQAPDGTGRVLPSIAALPADARSILVIRAGGARR